MEKAQLNDALYKLDEDVEFNKQGDKLYYEFDTDRLLYEELVDFEEGKLELGDVVLDREFIHVDKEDIRLCHTVLTHKTNAPKANIALFHGLSQNNDIFIEYAMQFVLNGYKVHTIDFRGYGWSTGVRGDATIIEFQKDVATVLSQVDPELPLFIYAHSMGCMIVNSFLINNPKLNISGVILSAPLTGAPKNVHIDRFRLYLLSVVSSELPEFMANPRTDVGYVTKKAKILKWYLTNSRVVPIMNSRQAHSLLTFMFHFKYNSKQFKYPILIHIGSEDKIVNNEVTKSFYENLGTEDKQMFEYEGAFHELQYEDCKKEMLKNTLDWLDTKLSQPVIKKFGVFDVEKHAKFHMLKKGAPFKYWKQVIGLLIAFYYFVGYILMVSKFINANRHEMIAFWPCSIFRKFFGKK